MRNPSGPRSEALRHRGRIHVRSRFLSCPSRNFTLANAGRTIHVGTKTLFMPSMAQHFQLRQAPVLPSMASRSSGHRAQLGGARSAREAALRKRLPSPLEKRCFSSASQTGQPAFWQGVLAIHGAAFRLSKAALLIGCADQPSPIHGAALLASIGPGLDILSSRSALEKRCFSSAPQTGPHPCLARPLNSTQPDED